MNSSIRSLFFDFDGTLVLHTPDTFELVASFYAEIGQPLSKERSRFGQRVRHQYFLDPAVRAELNGLPPDRFWQHFCRHLLGAVGIAGDLEAQARQLGDRFTETQFAYTCPDAGWATLGELRDRGYRLGLITNREHPERLARLLDDLGLRPYFDGVVVSGEVGCAKPEPGIFRAALERLTATASESVYVGDNYWADVVGARRAGLTPVLLDPERLFPEADCLVIDSLAELLPHLPGPTEAVPCP